MAKKFNFTVKVYYEDTDAGGVVYYANYLKFLERARSEAIYSLDYTNSSLLETFGILLIVKSCNIEYKRPAKFEDKLEIFSEVESFTKTSTLIVEAEVLDIVNPITVHSVDAGTVYDSIVAKLVPI